MTCSLWTMKYHKADWTWLREIRSPKQNIRNHLLLWILRWPLKRKPGTRWVKRWPKKKSKFKQIQSFLWILWKLQRKKLIIAWVKILWRKKSSHKRNYRKEIKEIGSLWFGEGVLKVLAIVAVVWPYVWRSNKFQSLKLLNKSLINNLQYYNSNFPSPQNPVLHPNPTPYPLPPLPNESPIAH